MAPSKKVRGCEPQTLKKYVTRPSPPYPANECCGRTLAGNDGARYVSVPNKNGVCRWVRADRPEPARQPPPAKAKAKPKKAQPKAKDCPPGKERNPATGRCKKTVVDTRR